MLHSGAKDKNVLIENPLKNGIQYITITDSLFIFMKTTVEL